MKIKIILLIICLGVVVFIWGNSLLSPELSSEFSRVVGEIVSSLFGTGNATETVGGISIRKMAHFVEFFALGAAVMSFLTISVKRLSARCYFAAFLGLLIPVIDETLQLFSNRGSSLRDVWIDVSGYVFGCSLVCVAFVLVEKLAKRGKNNNKK